MLNISSIYEINVTLLIPMCHNYQVNKFFISPNGPQKGKDFHNNLPIESVSEALFYLLLKILYNCKNQLIYKLYKYINLLLHYYLDVFKAKCHK